MRTNPVPAPRRPVEDGHPDAKFAVPRALHVVARTRLYDRLDAGAESPASLVSASAGWGKTLLVSSWLGARYAGAPAAWLSVGSADDDLRGFWVAVATALGQAVGGPAATLLRQAAVADSPPIRLPGLVAAAMTHAAVGTVLVVDNFHEVVSSEVHASILETLEAPIPNLRWVLATRRDPPWPLHRLRLAGLVTEIRTANLAFTANEGREMFDRLGVPLTTEQLEQLLRRTEGWAAGLRLAALPLRGTGADIGGFVDSFSGTHSTVSAYMLSEVLRPYADHALQFLERICILDLVCAELADAITGENDGATMLAELASSNLLVQPIGGDGRWFRLHALVSDVLRGRIAEPRVVRDLHRRAAEWHRKHGTYSSAVELALRGGLFRLAADILGLHLLGLVARGQAHELDVALSAVARESVLAHPELAAGLAGARMMHGHLEDVESLVAAAAAGSDDLVSPRRDRVRVVLDLVRMATCRVRGDLAGVLLTCRRIPGTPRELEALGLSDWGLVLSLVLSNRGASELWLGDVDAAEGHLRLAAEYPPATGSLRPRLNAQSHLALLESERGDLDEAQRRAHEAIAEAEAAGWGGSVQVVAAYLALVRVHLERDELVEVEPWLRRVDEIVAEVPEPHVRLMVAVLRAERWAAVNTGAALRDLRSASSALAGSVPARLSDFALLAQAWLAADLHDLTQAVLVMDELGDRDSLLAVLAAAELSFREQDLDAAEEHLTAAAASPRDARTWVTVDVLRALVAQAGGDDEAALIALERALRAAAPQRLRLPFTRRFSDLRRLLSLAVEREVSTAGFAIDLLRRTSPEAHPAPAPPSSMAVVLTPSEVLTVRYLASTLTNSEIAAELSLSINTVKTHHGRCTASWVSGAAATPSVGPGSSASFEISAGPCRRPGSVVSGASPSAKR